MSDRLSIELQKRSLVATYDRYARTYHARSSMQHENLRNLFAYIRKYGIPTVGRVLDVGCGFGAAGTLLTKFGEETRYCGLDLSREMLKLAREVLKREADLVEGDAEALPFSECALNLIISNSVYHWLNIPECGISPRTAWIEAYRTLKKGGVLAFSVSGAGTARKFQNCYRAVTKAFSNGKDFKPTLYRCDPIGSMDCSQIEQTLVEIGFDILLVTKNDEPIVFETALDYVDAVEAYGYELYMAPFSPSARKRAWNQLREGFAREQRSPYRHDQFMIYAIARK